MLVDLVQVCRQQKVFEQSCFHLEKETVALVVLVWVAYHEAITEVGLVVVEVVVVLVLSSHWDFRTEIAVGNRVTSHPSVRRDGKACLDRRTSSTFEWDSRHLG